VVRYYYCPSNSSTTGCIQLATQTCTNNYSAGETHTHTSPSLTMPATVMPGTRYLRAVVDADSQVTEGDETNNDHFASITVLTGNPDLYISQFSANVSGTTVMFAVTVCNQGADVTQDLSLGLYLNPASAPDCSTTADHTWTIAGGLANGACATRNYQQNNVATGVYMAWARADHACALSETDENNNNKSAPYAVGTVLPDMGPDLGPDGSLDAEPPDALVVDAEPTDFIEPFDAPPGSESVTPQQDATGPGKEGWFWPDTGSGDATTGGTAEGGCGCRVDGDRPRGWGPALSALALALLLLVRRRRY
jgi:MYXO-CTERM domain-containing protein